MLKQLLSDLDSFFAMQKGEMNLPGVAQGIPHFSWTAAHVLMWAKEVVDPWATWIISGLQVAEYL